MDRLTPLQRKKNMQANKSKGTSIELILGRIMWKSGLRYRKNTDKITGRPDFIFKSKKIAIFCDGEFWHGKDWEKRKYDHKSNQAFWHDKIERNIERDKEVNILLQSEGWIVLRFWENEIKRHPEVCLKKIIEEYEKADCRQKKNNS